MLVEDAVVRQVVLAVDAANLAARAHGARVREVAVEPRRPDERHDAVGLGRDLLDRGARGTDECRSQEEILGRVAGRRELGVHDEIGDCGSRLRERLEDEPAIAVEIADHGVELGESQPQRSFRLTVTNLSLTSRLAAMEITIERRFRGPSTSANGGYACGR